MQLWQNKKYICPLSLDPGAELLKPWEFPEWWGVFYNSSWALSSHTGAYANRVIHCGTRRQLQDEGWSQRNFQPHPLTSRKGLAAEFKHMANDFTHASLVKPPNKTLNNRVQELRGGWAHHCAGKAVGLWGHRALRCLYPSRPCASPSFGCSWVASCTIKM